MALDNLKNNATYEQIPTDINFTETGKIFEQYDKINSKKNKDSTENVDWINGTEILKKSRAEWKEKISGISNESKKNIIKASKKIPLKLTIENNWNRLIEFKLWDKLYKFYDFNIWLNQYQEEYKEFCKNKRWNPDDDDDFWPNRTYSEIQKNEREWFQYPDITKINELLEELWKNAKLSNKSEELWMFMYLTWMSWEYILLDYDLNLKNDNRSIRDGDGSTNKDAKSFFISIK